jgi:hypothetical protein
MAQSGKTPISLYHSTTALATPSALNLVDGELAININDGKLYYKDDLGVVQLIAAEGFIQPNSTQTLTNKRIDPRAVSAPATSGNLTINGDVTDLYKAEGLTGAITFLQPSGTPVDGQKLMIRIKDNGVIRAITWTTTSGAFRAVGVTLPTATTASKVTYVGCVYNATDLFWDAVATAQQA